MRHANKLADLGKLIAAKDSVSAKKNAEASQFQPESRDACAIRLERAIEVKCWRVIAKVAKGQKRPELIALLLRARECGATDADDIAGHILFERKSRRVVAQRLIQIAEGYGLLEREGPRYILTESGHAALEVEQVFVPEHGTWTVWASNDPLLATPILRVEPWAEPTAYEEVRGTERESARERLFKTLPIWIRNAVGVAGVPVVGGAPLRIEELEAKGEETDSESTLRAIWDVTGARLRIDGMLGGARVNAAVDAPEVGADIVWMQLLRAEGLWAQWDVSARALRVGFEETAKAERESLIRAVAFKRPDIEALGVFDGTTVEGIALRALSQQDAARWAEWRLRARICSYATTERFAEWSAEAVAPFSEFSPSTPTRHALATLAWQERKNQPDPHTWHLVAAADWEL